MGVEPVKGDGHRVGGKALDFDFAAAAAVHGVRAGRSEPRHVEMPGAAADLLVRCKRQPHRPMCDFRVFDQMRGRRHDLGDAGFVVGPEQSRPRRGHDVVAELLSQRRVVFEPQNGSGIVRQDEVAAIVLTMDDRLHAGARHLRRRIDMSDEADCRHIRFARRRRNGGRHITVLVDRRVCNPGISEFCHQVP